MTQPFCCRKEFSRFKVWVSEIA